MAPLHVSARHPRLKRLWQLRNGCILMARGFLAGGSALLFVTASATDDLSKTQLLNTEVSDVRNEATVPARTELGSAVTSMPHTETHTNQRRKAAVAQQAPVPKPKSKPDWSELTSAQRAALAPLASSWYQLEEVRKRKWIALSENFGSLSEKEQQLLHSRMRDWASLSATERSQARLNFSGVRELPAAERLEKWEAYQALPRDERQALRSSSIIKPHSAAIAVKPVAAARLAVTPVVATSAPATGSKLADSSAARSPMGARIASNTELIDPKTLLPHLLPVPANPRSASR